MIIHTLTVPQMVAEARKDFKAIRNKVEKPLREIRREHIKCKQEILQLLDPWRSPNKNNWLLLLHQTRNGPRMYCMAYYYDRDEKINAIWTTSTGMAFHIAQHVIERYGERFDPTANPLERLQRFFLENYFYAVDIKEAAGEDRWNVSIGMNHGMGLGFWEQNESIVYINTFVNHGQLFQAQADTMKRLDFERLLFRMSPGQRKAFVDLYKRTYPQDAGTPGMDWLERFAA